MWDGQPACPHSDCPGQRTTTSGTCQPLRTPMPSRTLQLALLSLLTLLGSAQSASTQAQPHELRHPERAAAVFEGKAGLKRAQAAAR